jgi:hypothetical protein
MPLSVWLDARTESLIGRLARKRRQTKSEVIRARSAHSPNRKSKVPGKNELQLIGVETGNR